LITKHISKWFLFRRLYNVLSEWFILCAKLDPLIPDNQFLYRSDQLWLYLRIIWDENEDIFGRYNSNVEVQAILADASFIIDFSNTKFFINLEKPSNLKPHVAINDSVCALNSLTCQKMQHFFPVTAFVKITKLTHACCQQNRLQFIMFACQ